MGKTSRITLTHIYARQPVWHLERWIVHAFFFQLSSLLEKWLNYCCRSLLVYVKWWRNPCSAFLIHSSHWYILPTLSAFPRLVVYPTSFHAGKHIKDMTNYPLLRAGWFRWNNTCSTLESGCWGDSSICFEGPPWPATGTYCTYW